MSGDDIGQLIYLILLLCVVGGYFLVSGRGNLGRTAQQALVWVLIFVGMVAAYGLWSDIRGTVLPRQTVMAGGTVELPRNADGHFYVVAELNGAPVRFVVDTGASDIVLTRDDARAAGIDPSTLDYLGQAMTANGPVRTARVRIDRLTLGEVTEEGVRAVVNDGEMDGSLLGMSYLSRFSKIEMAGDRLRLTR